MASTASAARAPNGTTRRLRPPLAAWQLPYLIWSIGAVITGLAVMEMTTYKPWLQVRW